MLRSLLRCGIPFTTLSLLLGIAACSSGGYSAGSAMVPSIGQPAGPSGLSVDARATPPVTAPVIIPYPYTNVWTTTTWAGPTAKPVAKKGSDSGTTTVSFLLDKKTGVYDVPEVVASKSGSKEVLKSAIGFLAHNGGIAQIILSDNYTFTAGPFVETGMDTYPNGQNSVDFPMTAGLRWSAAASHTSYVNIQQSGKGAYGENTALTEAADGTYRAQTSFSSTRGGQNQDNYASTTLVALGRPSVYTLSERAAGFNLLTQTFALPRTNRIAVTSSGTPPLPVRTGTAKVPDWYPGPGPLPSVLYADDFRVSGSATIPASCGPRKGGTATKVVERFANLDPVQGFYNTYTATYYLTVLSKHQFWFACIIEDYTNTTYANGWVMNGGGWGKPTSQQIGTEILIASKVRTAAEPANVRAIEALPMLPFPSLLFRSRQQT